GIVELTAEYSDEKDADDRGLCEQDRGVDSILELACHAAREESSPLAQRSGIALGERAARRIRLWPLAGAFCHVFAMKRRSRILLGPVAHGLLLESAQHLVRRGLAAGPESGNALRIEKMHCLRIRGAIVHQLAWLLRGARVAANHNQIVHEAKNF